MSLRFGINLDFPWEHKDEMDVAVRRMPKSRGLAELFGNRQGRGRRKNKPGRNEPCLCGSGKKYKKCCGGGS